MWKFQLCLLVFVVSTALAVGIEEKEAGQYFTTGHNPKPKVEIPPNEVVADGKYIKTRVIRYRRQAQAADLNPNNNLNVVHAPNQQVQTSQTNPSQANVVHQHPYPYRTNTRQRRQFQQADVNSNNIANVHHTNPGQVQVAQPNPNHVQVTHINPNPHRRHSIKRREAEEVKVAHLKPKEEVQIAQIPSEQVQVAQLKPTEGVQVAQLPSEQVQVAQLKPTEGVQVAQLPTEQVHVAQLKPTEGVQVAQLPSEQVQVAQLKPTEGVQVAQLPSEQVQVAQLKPAEGVQVAQLPSEQVQFVGPGQFLKDSRKRRQITGNKMSNQRPETSPTFVSDQPTEPSFGGQAGRPYISPIFVETPKPDRIIIKTDGISNADISPYFVPPDVLKQYQESQKNEQQ